MTRDWTKCTIRMREEMNLRNIYEGCELGINHMMVVTVLCLSMETL